MIRPRSPGPKPTHLQPVCRRHGYRLHGPGVCLQDVFYLRAPQPRVQEADAAVFAAHREHRPAPDKATGGGTGTWGSGSCTNQFTGATRAPCIVPASPTPSPRIPSREIGQSKETFTGWGHGLEHLNLQARTGSTSSTGKHPVNRQAGFIPQDMSAQNHDET